MPGASYGTHESGDDDDDADRREAGQTARDVSGLRAVVALTALLANLVSFGVGLAVQL